MLKQCVAAALLLLLPCLATAEVRIAVKNRIRNRSHRCAWCAVETLARHQRMKALYGLSEERTSAACPADIETALGDAGVTYRIQYPGSRGTAILTYAVEQGYGAAIGFRELAPGRGAHMVTLVDFDANNVRVIDSNDADGRIRTMSLSRFLYWWDGMALVLEPRTQESAESQEADANDE